jgi:hypothetical protein
MSYQGAKFKYMEVRGVRKAKNQKQKIVYERKYIFDRF